MFWDKVAPLYDFFEDMINHKVYSGTGQWITGEISSDDAVLECASGTGAITKYIAPVCGKLVATDMSKKMLMQNEKNCRGYDNVKFRYADIMHLKCPDGSFDKVIAGNVIHLLDEPELAVKELCRACKTGGKVIIPTYINDKGGKLSISARFLEMIGLRFTREFSEESYREFFRNAGYDNVRFHIVEGNMPCMIAVISK